jgi:hypothetical protein
VVCIYCLRRPAEIARRCFECHVYLDQLHSSDDQADREYASLIVLRAHRYVRLRAA